MGSGPVAVELVDADGQRAWTRAGDKCADELCTVRIDLHTGVADCGEFRLSRVVHLRRAYGMPEDSTPVDVLAEWLCQQLDDHVLAWFRTETSLERLRNDSAGRIAREAADILGVRR